MEGTSTLRDRESGLTMETFLLFIFTIFIFTALYSGSLLWSVAVAWTVFTMITKLMSFRSKPPTVFNNNELIRIVMVGKTGAGKSSAGNTILGQECFISELCPESLTKCCQKAYGEVDGQKVAVIDTPGLFDTGNTEEETAQDISQSISFASPGPHIFLVIIKLGRYTEEEKQTVRKIQEIFGKEADKYSMVLFTHGDLLKGKTIEEFLKGSKDLEELVAKCNNQYHVFNNEVKNRSQVRKLLDKIKNLNMLNGRRYNNLSHVFSSEVKDRSQVNKLLEKIKMINKKNGGSYYTTEMFQKAERAIEEEKQRILEEKEEQNRKEQEKLKKKLEEKFQQQLKKVKGDIEREKLREEQQREMEEEMKKQKEFQEFQARQEAEMRNSVIKIINQMIKFGLSVVLKINQLIKK